MGKHGCIRPFDELQIISWIVFPIFVIAYGCLVAPPLSLTIQVPISILFGTIVLFLFIAASKTTLSDSGDPQVYYGIQQLQDPERNTHWWVEGSKKCHVCKVHRQPLSEHCRVCNKCVETFDHHCKWLNTCIGSQNYQIFFTTLSLATLQVSLHFCLIVVQLIAYGASTNFQDQVQISMNATLGESGHIVWLILQCIVCVLLGIFSYLLFDLFKFHIGLIRHDDTTFDYFKNQNRRQRSINLRKKQQQQQEGGNRNNVNEGGFGGVGVGAGNIGSVGKGAVFPADFETELDTIRQGTICAAVCFPCFPSGAPNKISKDWKIPNAKGKRRKEEVNEVERRMDGTSNEAKIENEMITMDVAKVPSKEKKHGMSQPVQVEFEDVERSVAATVRVDKERMDATIEIGSTVRCLSFGIGVVVELRKDIVVVELSDWILTNNTKVKIYTNRDGMELRV